MISRGDLSLEHDDAGRIVLSVGDSDFCALSVDEARWLAIVALPAMLPGISSPAEVRDERLKHGG